VAYEWIDLEEFPRRRSGWKARTTETIIRRSSFRTAVSSPNRWETTETGRSLGACRGVTSGEGSTTSSSSVGVPRDSRRRSTALKRTQVLIGREVSAGGQTGRPPRRFDNYPGFPDGVGGRTAERMTQQALRYGVENPRSRGGQNNTTGRTDDARWNSRTRRGLSVLAPAVLVATGSTFDARDREGEATSSCRRPVLCDVRRPVLPRRKDSPSSGAATAALEEDLSSTQFADHVTSCRPCQTDGQQTPSRQGREPRPRMSVLPGQRRSHHSTGERVPASWESITVSCDGTSRYTRPPAPSSSSV